MDYNFIKSVFPNFTESMWQGNEPSRDGYTMCCGRKAKHWSCQLGTAETDGNDVLQADFSLGANSSVWICGGMMMLRKTLSNSSRYFCVNCEPPSGKYPMCITVETLELEEAKRLLSRKVDNCKIWEMVQKKALEMIKG